MVGLLDPLEVNGLTLKNRIVMPPMYSGLATPEGKVTDLLIKHYVEHSKTIGLLIIEHSYVSQNGKVSERQLGISKDSMIQGLEELSSRVHKTATPVIIQINHAGRTATSQVTKMTPIAPSSSESAVELKTSEVEALQEKFVQAAERAMKSGFDGVEIHGAHGFLLNQFFSPLSNHRQDKYGGSFKNRIRFPLEIVEKVREVVRGRLLLYRLGADDMDPKGVTIDDSIQFAVKLVEAGVDIVDVSGGFCGSRPDHLQGKQGYFIPQAQRIKEVVDVPVIGVGGIRDPEFANNVIVKGRVDLVAVGRELFHDPNWATTAVERLKVA